MYTFIQSFLNVQEDSPKPFVSYYAHNQMIEAKCLIKEVSLDPQVN